MKNRLTVFDCLPNVFPTAFENAFISGSIFDEIDKVFNGQKLRQMSVYPTDIYTVLEDDVAVAVVIEIACAGISKDRCKVRLDDNKLFVNIGMTPEEKPIEEINKESTVIDAEIESSKSESETKNKRGKKVKADEEKIEELNTGVEEAHEPKIEKQYIQRQITGRESYMSWTLGNKIDKKQIEVSFINGVLKITCPYRKNDIESNKILEIN